MRMAQLRLYLRWSLSAALHDAEYVTDVFSATATNRVNPGLIMTYFARQNLNRQSPNSSAGEPLSLLSYLNTYLEHVTSST